ncbi:MAG: hypothetical protein WD770_10220 [Actinomycetota bacterium]
MQRIMVGLVALVVFAVGVATPARAGHDADVHSDNMSLVATFDDGGEYAGGTDLAFWGTRAVAGNFDPGGFRLLDIRNPRKPVEVGQFACNGSQSDVSIWRDLVFVSVDGARTGPGCDSEAAAAADSITGIGWEGIRVVSIANPKKPTQIATVRTDCGSHTHTLVPDLARRRLLLYVLSYPLGAPTPTCSPVSHRKISVVEVPLADPASARVTSTPSVGLPIGCHDVTVFLPKMIAAAACITETQLWDITDPADPVITTRVVNPLINIHHSTVFSWDGNTFVIGDELGGAAVAPGCVSGEAPLGSLWFYEVSDPTMPLGSYSIERDASPIDVCTAHEFNVVPLRSERDVLVSSWYTGGTIVLDFTDPANPQELGHYVPQEGEAAVHWSSYWYNGLIYANGFDRGIDVLRIRHPSLTPKQVIPLGHLNPTTQERLPKR